VQGGGDLAGDLGPAIEELLVVSLEAVGGVQILVGPVVEDLRLVVVVGPVAVDLDVVALHHPGGEVLIAEAHPGQATVLTRAGRRARPERVDDARQILGLAQLHVAGRHREEDVLVVGRQISEVAVAAGRGAAA